MTPVEWLEQNYDLGLILRRIPYTLEFDMLDTPNADLVRNQYPQGYSEGGGLMLSLKTDSTKWGDLYHRAVYPAGSDLEDLSHLPAPA